MLLLLFCALLSEWLQPGVLTQSAASLFAKTNRTYKDSPVTFMGQLLVTLFRVGTIAMALCLCFCSATYAPFSAFGVACGWVLAALLLKMVCAWLLNYTFSLDRRFGAVYEPYGDLFTVGCLALYPAVLILLHFGTPRIACWVFGIWVALLIGIWLIRCLRVYLVKPMALVYLLLYIMTMEILPMAGLAYVSAKTITLL